MKKSASIFVIILLLVSMALLFSSCTGSMNATKERTDPKTADELFTLIDEKMDAQTSYEVSESIDALFYTSGIEIVISGLAQTVKSSSDDDKHYFYTNSELIMEVSEQSRQFIMESETSYQNGVYYRTTIDDGVEQKIYTDMTDEEFLDFYKDESVVDLDVLKSTERSFEKTEDGWVFTAAGFTKKAINNYLNEIDFDEEFIGDDPIDIEIRIEANSEFCATSGTLTFVFDESSKNVPSLEIKIDYSNFGSAEKILLNKDDFSEMDVRVLDAVEEFIANAKDTEEGEFVCSNSVTISWPQNKQITNEVATIKYGEERKGYYFDIETDINGKDYKVVYENGVQTITTKTETSTLSLTEDEARSTVEYYLDPSSYNKLYVSEILKNSDGKTYVITLSQVDEKKYRDNYYDQLGAIFTGAKEKLTVTMENGEITQMHFSSNATGYLDGNTSFHVNIILSFTIYDLNIAD